MSASGLTLVFDLDDTLYPERDYVRSGLAAAARAFGDAVPEVGEGPFLARAISLFGAGARGRIFDQALAEVGQPASAELVARLVEAYRDHEPTSLALFEDARAALARWGARGPLGLVTDGYLTVQRAKVRSLGIERLFGAVCYTDALGGRDAWKPSPRGFVDVMSRLGRPASRYVYVADNPNKDFQAPRALGWRTVRVRREGGEHACVEAPDANAAPDVEVASLDALDADLVP